MQDPAQDRAVVDAFRRHGYRGRIEVAADQKETAMFRLSAPLAEEDRDSLVSELTLLVGAPVRLTRSAIRNGRLLAFRETDPTIWIEDEFHAQVLLEFDDVDSAISDLRRLETLSPDQLEDEIGPTPCTSNCGHRELVVYADDTVIARAKPSKRP
jgi:hypothetical protein